MAEKVVGKCVTVSGFPLEIELEWPFHASATGSDWYVLHGTARLDDGGPLHADVAVHLTASIREVLTAVDSQEALMATVNTIRKAVDDKQLELLKTGKRQPCPSPAGSTASRTSTGGSWKPPTSSSRPS